MNSPRKCVHVREIRHLLPPQWRYKFSTQPLSRKKMKRLRKWWERGGNREFARWEAARSLEEFLTAEFKRSVHEAEDQAFLKMIEGIAQKAG